MREILPLSFGCLQFLTEKAATGIGGGYFASARRRKTLSLFLPFYSPFILFTFSLPATHQGLEDTSGPERQKLRVWLKRLPPLP